MLNSSCPVIETVAADTLGLPGNVSLGSGLSKLAGLWAEYTSPAANPEGLRQKLKELGALQSKMQTEADTNAKDKDDSDLGNLGAPFTPGPGGNANL